MMVLLGICFMPAQAIHASSYAIAKSEINYSLTTTGLITWLTKTSGTWAGVEDFTNPQITDEYNSPLLSWNNSNSNVNIPEASATGNLIVDSTLSASASAGPNAYNSPSASSKAYITGSFKFNNGGGSVILNASSYSVIYDLLTGASPGSSAYIFTRAVLELTKTSPAGSGFDEIYREVLTLDPNFTEDDNINRSFNKRITYASGNTGTFKLYTESGASASSPVPIPAPIMLLGAGLVGLAGLRKRIKA